MHRTVLRFFVAAALGFLVAGCAGGSSAELPKRIWKRTQNAASATYSAARSLVTKTINSISSTLAKKPFAVDAPPKRSTAASPPESRAPNYEANINSDHLTPILKPQTRGSGLRTLRLIPRKAQSAAELHREIDELTREIKGEKNLQKKKYLTRKRQHLKRLLKKIGP